MSLRLSNAEITRVSTAASVLLSPLAESPDEPWPILAAQRVRSLVPTDRAVVVLQADGAMRLYGDALDLPALHSYASYYGERDFGMRRQQELGVEVWSRRMLWSVGALAGSEYYNDFAVPNRLHDSVGISIAAAEVSAHARIALLCDRKLTARMDARYRTLLQLVLPAFRTGVYTYLRFAGRMSSRGLPAELADVLTEGVLISDRRGRVLHRNPAFWRTLADEPERDSVLRAVDLVLRALTHVAPGRPAAAAGPALREVRTAEERYRIAGSYVGGDLPPEERLIAVTLERVARRPLPRSALQAQFSLTEREIDVARLLARGRSNAEIAADLAISRHTAERHTEHTLMKLGVHSRAQVADRLLDS